MNKIKRFLKHLYLSFAIMVSLAMFCFAFVQEGKDNHVGAVGLEIEKEIQTETVLIENVDLYSDMPSKVRCGDIINLNVKLEPEYAIETAKSVEYFVISGNNQVEQIGSIIKVKSNATLGSTIEVKAIVDGVESNTLNFVVVINDVTEVKILNTESKINMGQSLKLETDVFPQSATNKDLKYSITHGAEFASISKSGVISVNNNISSGNSFITVRAQSVSNEDVYAEKTFHIYVPTEVLEIGFSNQNPKPGESIILEEVISNNASKGESNFIIREEDKRYVKSLEGNVLTFIDGITDFNPSVTVYYSRDGISVQRKIDLFIPTISLEFVNLKDNLKQGSMAEFAVKTIPENATIKNLKYTLSNYEYASISSDGILTTITNNDKEDRVIKVTASIDDVSVSAFVTIESSKVIISADNYNPITNSTTSDIIKLSVKFFDDVVTDGVTYKVVKGSEYIEGGKIDNGSFKIATGISDFNPTIIIYAIYQGFESNEIIITPNILVENLIFENESITEVEQQKTYNFAATCQPINATKSSEQLKYSLNVSSNIATIDNNGILYISNDAEIGSTIVISVYGPDGVYITHEIKVKKVYAEDFEISSVVNQNGEKVENQDIVNPGDTLTFNINFNIPFNVSNSQKVYLVEYFDGSDAFEKIGNQIKIKTQNQIKDNNPYITFKITSVQGENIITKFFTVGINIAVEKIEYKQIKTTVYEGEVVLISEIVSAVVKPDNSTLKTIEFSVSGNATRLGDYVAVHKNLENGDRIFTLHLYAGNIEVELEYNIYVDASNIEISADNYSPMTTINGGETFTISTVKDLRATATMTFRIINGSSLIEGNYNDKDIIPLNFNEMGIATFPFKIVSSDKVKNEKLIVLSVTQGNLTKMIEIVIYKPIEDFSLTSKFVENNISYIERGINNSLNVNFTEYASEGNKWTVNSSKVNIDNRTNPTITVPQTEVAGTIFTITVSTNDRLNKQFTFNFVVKKLDNGLFTFVNGSNASSNNPYTVDSQGVKINISKPQLWVGRTTDIKLTYNGFNLENYGIKINNNQVTKFSHGLEFADLEMISNDQMRLSINSSASGKEYVEPIIEVIDGKTTYTINLSRIYIFREIVGDSVLTNGTITSNNTQLTFKEGNQDKLATTSLADAFIFYGSSLSGVSITEKGVFTVEYDDASENQIILVKTIKKDKSYTQTYNGVGIEFQKTYTLKIRRVSLSVKDGDGNSSICAVDGRSTKIKVPTKAGYTFAGYYANVGGKNILYYDAAGNLKVIHSSYQSVTQLSVSWTANQYYYITKHICSDKGCNGNFNADKTSQSRTYDAASFTYSAEGWDSHSFSKFVVNGVTYSSSSQSFGNLTTTAGETVTIYIYYSHKSCVASGTLITLADGTQKAVEELDGSELLLTWNFETGKAEASPILMNVTHGEDVYEIIELNFGDNTIVKVIDEHGFWDIDLKEFVYINKYNADSFIGHKFINQYIDENGDVKNEQVELTSFRIYDEFTNSWSPVTCNNLSIYVNGFLSVASETQGFTNIFEVGDDMKYDEEKFKEDIETFGLLDYEEFADKVPLEIFEVFNAKYLKVSMGKGLITYEQIIMLIEANADYLLSNEEGEIC